MDLKTQVVQHVSRVQKRHWNCMRLETTISNVFLENIHEKLLLYDLSGEKCMLLSDECQFARFRTHWIYRVG